MREWIFIPLFFILLIGFFIISLILVQGLEVLKEFTTKVIEFIGRLFS